MVDVGVHGIGILDGTLRATRGSGPAYLERRRRNWKRLRFYDSIQKEKSYSL